MQQRNESTNQPLEKKLDALLDAYQAHYQTDVIKLIKKLGEEEVWRLFIDGVKQPIKTTLEKLLKHGLSEKLLYFPAWFVWKEYPDFSKEYPMNDEDKDLEFRDWINKVDKKRQAWDYFEQGEPGYLKAMLSTFDYLLKSNEKLSIAFIERIQGLATNAVANLDYDNDKTGISKPGKIRSRPVDFQFTINRNASISGLVELIEKINNGNEYLSLQLYEDHKSKNSTHTFNFLEKIEEDAISNLMPAYFSNEEDRETMFGKNADFKKHCKLSSTEYVNSSEGVDQQIHRLVTTELERLINDYYSGIKQAQTPFEKLKVIVTFTRECEQLHPFRDANCRTFCMAILNYLLIKNNFPLVIQDDPNRFDGFSIEELMEEMVNSMERTLQLAEMKPDEKKLYGVKTSELYERLGEKEKIYFKNAISHVHLEMSKPTMTTHLLTHPHTTATGDNKTKEIKTTEIRLRPHK